MSAVSRFDAMPDFDADEPDAPIDILAAQPVVAASSAASPRLLIVICATAADAAAIRSSYSQVEPPVVALILADGAFETHSWNVMLGQPAGGIVFEIATGVCAVDISSIPLGLSHIAVLNALFKTIGVPSEGVVVLDRKSGLLSESRDFLSTVTSSQAAKSVRETVS
ncbi:hypothetical protein HDU83_001475 [Entophlyctis luteolus]|nr:hypothetical protein HDU82_004544 [Entophlyctis luteolus]KAJ3356268.1 hypothetical protein HDU83_001475 [Entophlyctis luteolus]KAJ3393006.1 hypothetical protein HDU84_002946 [Entophlyctis sp. JEL0112]